MIKNLGDTFTKRTGGIGGYKTTPTIILCSGIIQTKDDVKSLIANKIVRQTVLNTRYSKTSINYENTYQQGKSNVFYDYTRIITRWMFEELLTHLSRLPNNNEQA